jgi:small subunit ribosomal protein S17
MTGVVKSNKMTKALIVVVTTKKMHPKYKKYYNVRKSYAVSCSDSSKYQVGQQVEIVPCRPISRTIRFKLVE